MLCSKRKSIRVWKIPRFFSSRFLLFSASSCSLWNFSCNSSATCSLFAGIISFSGWPLKLKKFVLKDFLCHSIWRIFDLCLLTKQSSKILLSSTFSGYVVLSSSLSSISENYEISLVFISIKNYKIIFYWFKPVLSSLTTFCDVVSTRFCLVSHDIHARDDSQTSELKSHLNFNFSKVDQKFVKCFGWKEIPPEAVSHVCFWSADLEICQSIDENSSSVHTSCTFVYPFQKSSWLISTLSLLQVIT